MLKLLVILCGIFAGATPLIVPGELPTILSLIYSNIPTIKKGTDSRLGWGFRLGNRADFQVLVELGPQTNTQPLGNQQDAASSSSSKRDVGSDLKDVLWAQRQSEKNRKEQKEEKESERAHFSNSDGGNWLKRWSDTMRPPENSVLGIGEVDAKLVIPDEGD